MFARKGGRGEEGKDKVIDSPHRPRQCGSLNMIKALLYQVGLFLHITNRAIKHGNSQGV